MLKNFVITVFTAHWLEHRKIDAIFFSEYLGRDIFYVVKLQNAHIGQFLQNFLQIFSFELNPVPFEDFYAGWVFFKDVYNVFLEAADEGNTRVLVNSLAFEYCLK